MKSRILHTDGIKQHQVRKRVAELGPKLKFKPVYIKKILERMTMQCEYCI